MIDAKTRAKYLPTIGIECHIQFNTKTKLFSGVGNDAREAEPNSLISHIDLGMPGALPVLNAQAVQLGIKMALALGTEPQKFSKFDRKHYFYPDLPMGYQITQFYNPIIRGGQVTIELDGQPKSITILEAHLEADAGKSTHPAGADYSLVDLNRAGTPLLEVVSEPEMHSPQEARLYAHELYLIAKFAQVSEANLFYGNMRFDVNVSVSQTDQLGTRSETKNLNSFRSVERAAQYEIDRQIELLEKGQKIVQETRGWDDAKQKTISQRGKEEAHDYRYMPEPDVPPIELTEAMIEPVRQSMPVLPAEWRLRLKPLGLDRSQIDTLLEAQVEGQADYLNLLEGILQKADKAKAVANWMVNLEIPLRHQASDSDSLVTKAEPRIKLYEQVYQLVQADKLSSTAAKQLLTELLSAAKLPANIADYAQQQGLIQMSDNSVVDKIVTTVLAANPQAAEDVKNGQDKAIGFLVGQVMKQSQGQANPQLAQQLIRSQLGL
ncbi:MAG: Asp-tRNA(Asn)/Glu-tRNA(Gln) amidotransferase subunit GatB [Candidatus Saccharimonadales bacterium]